MFHVVIIVLAVLAVSLPSYTARATETLTMDAAIQAALAANPTYAAAAYASDAARARPPQAATPPDPQFMVQFSQVPIDTLDVNQGMITYMVQQEIPFPSKLVYGYKAEKRAADAMLSRQDMTGQELVRQVKLSYLEVWRLQQERKIEHRTLAIYRQNKAAAETSYAALKGSIADPVRAAVDLGDIQARLTIIDESRIDAIARLSALMDKPLDPDTNVAAPPRAPSVAKLGSLIEQAKDARPEITESDKMIESRRARVGLAKSQYGPDLTLRWGYDDRPNQQNAWTGRFMLSVPLWSLSKQRFGVRESKALLKRAQSLNQEAVLMTEAQVKSAHARFKAAKKRVRIYSGSVVPRARQLLRSSQEAYRSGKGDFLSIVDSIRSLNNAQLMLVRAKVGVQKAFADLERAVGAPLGKEGL